MFFAVFRKHHKTKIEQTQSRISSYGCNTRVTCVSRYSPFDETDDAHVRFMNRHRVYSTSRDHTHVRISFHETDIQNICGTYIWTQHLEK